MSKRISHAAKLLTKFVVARIWNPQNEIPNYAPEHSILVLLIVLVVLVLVTRKVLHERGFSKSEASRTKNNSS